MVTVYPTACPGTAALVFAVLTIVSPGISTFTVAVQRGSVLPDGQLLPAAAVDRMLVSTLLPVSGLFTVTVPVTVIVPPTGMLPVQVITEPLTVSVPDVAVWSPFAVASSCTPAVLIAIVVVGV